MAIVINNPKKGKCCTCKKVLEEGQLILAVRRRGAGRGRIKHKFCSAACEEAKCEQLVQGNLNTIEAAGNADWL